MYPFDPRFLIAGLTALVLSSAAVAEPTPEEIARAVMQLGDDDAAVRQKAAQLLWEAGPAAEAALTAATKGGDADVVLRAAVILDKFKWGIYPDTPAGVVDLIKSYRAAANQPDRDKALRGLLGRGSKGLLAIRKIAAAEGDPAAAAAVNQFLIREAATAAAAFVSEDKFDELEELLAAAAASRNPRALQDYTACLMLRDRVAAKFKQLEPKANEPATAHLLAYLCRAKGDLGAALTHARKAGDEPLVDTLLILNRDWTALGDRLAARPRTDETGLGFLLLCQLRGGKKDEAAKTVAALKEVAAKKPPGDGTIWWAAKPLFVNDLIDDALEVLPRGQNHTMTMDVLAAQLRHREAIELAEKLARNKEPGWVSAVVRQVRLLRELGDAKKADAALDDLLKADKSGDAMARRELVGLLFEVGRKDQAFEALAEQLTSNPQASRDVTLWSMVFPKERGKQAATWFQFLRGRDAADTLADTLNKIRNLMDGKPEKKVLTDTVDEARAWAKSLQPNQWLGDSPFLVLAEWCGDVKLTDQERECLLAAAEQTGSPLAWQKLGEHDAAAKKWKEAAESFKKAYDKNQTRPEPLWLWGWAVEQGGDAKEGIRLMERAHWVALGQEEKLYALSRVMGQKNRAADITRVNSVMARMGLLDSWYLLHAHWALAAEAEARKDFAAAADSFELSVLLTMRRGTFYYDQRFWVTQPARVHALRVRAHLEAGKIDEAMTEARAGLKMLPGDLNLAILVVPKLDAMGKTKEGDELFDQAYSSYAALVGDHPDSAMGHNNLAWLAARCRRKLDEAVKHAQKATTLEPDRMAYLDTLAEAHFQKGDTSKAIELMKKCIEGEPTNEFYKKQMKRYEDGDPRTDVPETR